MSEAEDRRTTFAEVARRLEESIPHFREHVIIWLGGMYEQRLGDPPVPPPHVSRYIAARLLPIMEAEQNARKGRPGARGAGEMVQAFVDGGMTVRHARALVKRRMAPLGIDIKLSSIAASHRRFLATGKQALLYSVTEPAAGVAPQNAIKGGYLYRGGSS